MGEERPLRLKVIVSDFHLGKGERLQNGGLNPLEDFRYDQRFSEFLAYYSTGENRDCEVELIFNGDILNLIQTDYRGHFPTVITESISTQKLEAIIDGHPIFFDSLAQFLRVPGHSLTYLIGNHDQEMLWKQCRTLVETRLGTSVKWKNTHYQVDGIHIEHGHQYEAINRLDPTRFFLTENLPEPILNLPWGTLFTLQFLVRLKQQRPVIDKVRPFRHLVWWSFLHDTWATLVHVLQLLFYFVGYQFSRTRLRVSHLRTTWKMISEAAVFPDLTESARRILRNPDIHTVIFGHTHVYKQVQIASGKQYLNLGSWTEIVSLDLDSFARRTRLTYALGRTDSEGKTSVTLRHWIGQSRLEDDAFAV